MLGDQAVGIGGHLGDQVGVGVGQERVGPLRLVAAQGQFRQVQLGQGGLGEFSYRSRSFRQTGSDSGQMRAAL